MDWIRKHLLDLADLCKDCEENPTLTMVQRKAFAETYLVTTQFSSLPSAGGNHNVTNVIAKLCAACRGSIHNDCSGRTDWKQACPLLGEHKCESPVRIAL